MSPHSPPTPTGKKGLKKKKKEAFSHTYPQVEADKLFWAPLLPAPASGSAWHKATGQAAVRAYRQRQVIISLPKVPCLHRGTKHKQPLHHLPLPPGPPKRWGLELSVAAPSSCSWGQKSGRFLIWPGLPFCLSPPQTLQQAKLPPGNVPGTIQHKTNDARRKPTQPSPTKGSGSNVPPAASPSAPTCTPVLPALRALLGSS